MALRTLYPPQPEPKITTRCFSLGNLGKEEANRLIDEENASFESFRGGDRIRPCIAGNM